MPIPLIDNFNINSELPIDNRIIASSSTERNAISYKYDGLKVFQLDNRITYTWNKTSSSWDTLDSNTLGQGIANYISKWDSTGLGLTSSSIMSYPKIFNEVNQKVGIGGTPSEALQINGNYTDATIGTSSMPFVVHKGVNTVIGENWYYDMSLLQDKAFDLSFASSTITFKNGGVEFKGRTAGSVATMKGGVTVNVDSSITINGTTSIPLGSDGTIYNDTSRLKVKESGEWRTISRVYEVYSSLISQSATSAPTETLLESTIGSGTWSYVGVGIYNLTITNGFVGTVPKINGFVGPYTSTGVFFGVKINDSTYQIRTLFSVGATQSDNLLSTTMIEIRVY